MTDAKRTSSFRKGEETKYKSGYKKGDDEYKSGYSKKGGVIDYEKESKYGSYKKGGEHEYESKHDYSEKHKDPEYRGEEDHYHKGGYKRGGDYEDDHSKGGYKKRDYRNSEDYDHDNKHRYYKKGGEDYGDDYEQRHHYASYKPKDHYAEDSSGGYGGEEHSRWWRDHRRHHEDYSGWEETDPSYSGDSPKNDYYGSPRKHCWQAMGKYGCCESVQGVMREGVTLGVVRCCWGTALLGACCCNHEGYSGWDDSLFAIRLQGGWCGTCYALNPLPLPPDVYLLFFLMHTCCAVCALDPQGVVLLKRARCNR
jgi:hypothetical protein